MPVARGLGLGFDDPVIVRDLPETARGERLDPGVVLVVTASRRRRHRRRRHRPRARPHHRRRSRGAVTQPVLEPRARRSPHMTERRRPRADWVLYEKDPATKIATLTLNRPERLNAPTIAMRLRYADLLHQANIDDDVKVLVIRGDGDDFGTGQDLPEFMEAVRHRRRPPARGAARGRGRHVPAPPQLPARRHDHPGGSPTPAAAAGPCRSSRRSPSSRPRATCYGWHFYQAGDADLVDRVGRRALRPRRLPLRGRRAPDVVVGHVDGDAQVPGDGLHRPAVHRGRDGRVRLREQRGAARPARSRGAEVRARPAPRTGRPTSSSCRRPSSRS